MTAARRQRSPIPVDIDDEVEICRLEGCSKLGIHAAHAKPINPRGRRPKNCPRCKEPLGLSKAGGVRTYSCAICGFTR